MSAAGLSLETAMRRGGLLMAAAAVAVVVVLVMRAVTAERLARRVVVRAGEGGVIVVIVGWVEVDAVVISGFSSSSFLSPGMSVKVLGMLSRNE